MKKKLKSAVTCKKRQGEPENYIEWHYWAEAMYGSGYRQQKCKKCGLWHIWKKTK